MANRWLHDLKKMFQNKWLEIKVFITNIKTKANISLLNQNYFCNVLITVSSNSTFLSIRMCSIPSKLFDTIQ